MAKNRYGWQKRAKELARKQKHDDKIMRRQGKAPMYSSEKAPETAAEGYNGLEETEPTA